MHLVSSVDLVWGLEGELQLCLQVGHGLLQLRQGGVGLDLLILQIRILFLAQFGGGSFLVHFFLQRLQAPVGELKLFVILAQQLLHLLTLFIDFPVLLHLPCHVALLPLQPLRSRLQQLVFLLARLHSALRLLDIHPYLSQLFALVGQQGTPAVEEPPEHHAQHDEHAAQEQQQEPPVDVLLPEGHGRLVQLPCHGGWGWSES
mmetsp:Transcript_2935/g.6679  ORF Transcript_2935/g.6679 Transcript_2935/m.6679 type:complete len:203 (+) Transcript_2935:726-1334(+)